MLNVSSVLISLARCGPSCSLRLRPLPISCSGARSSTKRCMNADATRVSGNAHTCCIARCKPPSANGPSTRRRASSRHARPSLAHSKSAPAGSSRCGGTLTSAHATDRAAARRPRSRRNPSRLPRTRSYRPPPTFIMTLYWTPASRRIRSAMARSSDANFSSIERSRDADSSLEPRRFERRLDVDQHDFRRASFAIQERRMANRLKRAGRVADRNQQLEHGRCPGNEMIPA